MRKVKGGDSERRPGGRLAEKMEEKISKEARMELHKRARSDAAHRAEEEVREYLQQFYCRIIP